jgi:hypothetical protein
MKTLFLCLALFPLWPPAVYAGERVTFRDDAYSFEFPQGWVKTRSPTPGADFARKSPDETAIISVHADPIPEDARADLDASAETGAKAYAEAIGFEDEALVSEGALDGCASRFLTLIPEDGQLGIVAVMIDAEDHLVRLQATMTLPLDPETRDACLKIVQSFRRENPDAGPPPDEADDAPADDAPDSGE